MAQMADLNREKLATGRISDYQKRDVDSHNNELGAPEALGPSQWSYSRKMLTVVLVSTMTTIE